MQVRGLRDRDYRNETGDVLARASLDEIQKRGAANSFKWVAPGARWGGFVSEEKMGNGRYESVRAPQMGWRNGIRLNQR